MKKKAAILILILIAAAALAAYLLHYNKNAGPEDVFWTTGIVEAVEYNIESKLPGKLTFLGFREGDAVHAGELLAEVDPSEYEAVRAQATAAVTTARRQIDSGYAALNNTRAKTNAAKSEALGAMAQERAADAALAQAETDLVRADELYDKGVIPRSELDRAITNWDTLSAQLDAAAAAKDSAESGVKAAEAAQAQSETEIASLKAKVAEAESALALADVRLFDTKAFSPADAVVDYRYLEPGEMAGPGIPILTLLETSSIWARADVDERYVGRIRNGQPARVMLEYMPDKVFEGEVFDIGREADFATERDVTRGRQDIRTFRTRVRVNDPDGVLKAGMTVIVEFPLN